MNFSSLKVLVFEGYGRQILPYLRSFKKLGCETTVLCGSKLDLAYCSRFADKKILGTCDMEDYEGSEKCVLDIIKSGEYDVVVPMGDFAAEILANNKEELSHFAKIAVNDKDNFLKALDKISVMDICMKKGIPCPKTLIGVKTYDDVLERGISFPLVVKPRSDCGARGFHLFEKKEELKEFATQNDLSNLVVQEYIPQSDMNMSCSMFIDNEGEVKSSYVYASRRWYPLKGGTGTFNQIVDRPDVEETCKRLIKEMNLTGTVGVDLIHDFRDDTAKVIEINPRVLACAKIGFEAGIDPAKQLLEKEFGEPVTDYSEYDKTKCVRMSQTDVLWFLKSPDRFKSRPSWFSHKNTKDQTFSWDDPFPWFAFLFRGLKNYKSEMESRG